MSRIHTVRRLTAMDSEAWARLRQESLKLHPLAFGATPADDPDSLVQSFVHVLKADNEDAVFGAFADSSLIGIAGIRRHSRGKQEHKAMLWGMYVTASHRGSGVGEKLLRACVERAGLWPGIEKVCLSVTDVATEAKRLYERVGFRVWGREARAFSWQGQYADETLMVFELTQSM
jgi:RimJ/RimL family protein N-acetyltransferase